MQKVWFPWLTTAGATLSAFLLYVATAAPGLTWAHHGADGGELLTAALTNGVPHPPGYPLYMLLLQGWLGFWLMLFPNGDIAWYGNLLSATTAALSVGITVCVVAALLQQLHSTQTENKLEVTNTYWRWLWAMVAGLAWAVTPLAWSQALITEVYALHMVFIALLGWAVLVKRGDPRWLIPVVALGSGHHLTFILLLPAVLYYLWFACADTFAQRLRYLSYLIVGCLAALLFHLRTPIVAAALPPSPVNWGYPDNWEGFWWLVSGAAYRSYLFGAPTSTLLARVAAWAGTITSQLTPVGLALMLVGLSYWDRHRPHLRNWSLLWLIPISIYAINYYTRDSEIYLLPVTWLSILWLSVGMVVLVDWWGKEVPSLWQRFRPQSMLPAMVTAQFAHALMLTLVVGLGLLVGWRWTTISARHDLRAQQFLAETSAVLEPTSIIISSADAETFTLWYGAWGSGELLSTHPDLVVLNYALFQFPWYRRLVASQYPTVVGESNSVEEVMALNPDRPVFFSENFSFWPEAEMDAIGPIWRYVPAQ